MLIKRECSNLQNQIFCRQDIPDHCRVTILRKTPNGLHVYVLLTIHFLAAKTFAHDNIFQDLAFLSHTGRLPLAESTSFVGRYRLSQSGKLPLRNVTVSIYFQYIIERKRLFFQLGNGWLKVLHVASYISS